MLAAEYAGKPERQSRKIMVKTLLKVWIRVSTAKVGAIGYRGSRSTARISKLTTVIVKARSWIRSIVGDVRTCWICSNDGRVCTRRKALLAKDWWEGSADSSSCEVFYGAIPIAGCTPSATDKWTCRNGIRSEATGWTNSKSSIGFVNSRYICSGWYG